MISPMKVIAHRKGDTETFRFNFMKDNEPYTIPPNEIYYFTVKRKAGEDTALISKQTTSNGKSYVEFTIDKKDTLEMPFGNYVWDLRCKNGDVISTPVSIKSFELKEVVGDV